MFRFAILLLVCLLVFPILLAAGLQSAAGDRPPQQAPARPAVSAEELARRKALLSARVTELYELYRIPSWRKAEAYFTEESKDVFYETHKGAIIDFTVKDLQINKDGAVAIAVVDIKFRLGQFPDLMVMPQKSRWLWERDNWYQKLERAAQNPLAPFLASQPASAQTTAMVRFEKNQAEIARGPQKYTFRFQNTGKETISLRPIPHDCLCMELSTDKEKYAPDEWGEVRVETDIDLEAKGQEYVVQVMMLPGPQWAVIRLRLP